MYISLAYVILFTGAYAPQPGKVVFKPCSSEGHGVGGEGRIGDSTTLPTPPSEQLCFLSVLTFFFEKFTNQGPASLLVNVFKTLQQ